MSRRIRGTGAGQTPGRLGKEHRIESRLRLLLWQGGLRCACIVAEIQKSVIRHFADEGACKTPWPNLGVDQPLHQVAGTVGILNHISIKTIAKFSLIPFNPPIGIKAAMVLPTVKRIQGTINRNKLTPRLNRRIRSLTRVILHLNLIILRCRGPHILPNQLDLHALLRAAKR